MFNGQNYNFNQPRYNQRVKLEIRQPSEQRQLQGNNQIELGHVHFYKGQMFKQQTFQCLRMMLSFMTLNLIRRCLRLLALQKMKMECHR